MSSKMSRHAYKCCINKCPSDGLHSHRFPNPRKYMESFKKWVDVIGGDLNTLDPYVIYEKKRVCSLHFIENDFSPGTSNRLKNNCVPRVNLSDDSVSTVLTTPKYSGDSLLQPEHNDTVLTSKYDSDNLLQSTSFTDTVLKKSEFSEDESDLEGISVLPDDLDPLLGSAEKLKRNVPGKSAYKCKSKTGTLSKIGVRYTSKLTPRCKSLYTDSLLLRRKLQYESSKTRTLKQRLKAAENMSESYVFKKFSDKLTPAATLFTNLQIRETKKKNKGRRFTLDEKLLCLSLFKKSPKSYKLLSSLFTLPSRRLLSSLLSQVSIEPGISPVLMEVLKDKVKKLKPKEKYCTLMFDEVNLSTELHYNESLGKIDGFENDGCNTTQQFADHALVFMVKGIVKNFKQPIAFTFVKGSTNKFQLCALIKKVVQSIHKTGLEIIATVCDQATTNEGVIKLLHEETRAYYLKKSEEYKGDFYQVECGNEIKKIIPLFDPPHLLKGIRNNLLQKNLSFVINNVPKEAKWQHLVDLYKLDSTVDDVKMLPRLTDEHIIPGRIKKMKVKFASQVFSQRVSALMKFLANTEILDSTASDTAELCLFIDKLFDSVNGNFSKIKDGKIYRSAVKKNSPHHVFWNNALKILNSMVFIDPVTKKKSSAPQPRTLQNWVKTIKGFQNIFKVMSEKGVHSLLLRNFNQDPLENFFGAVRSLGYRNNNPSTQGFASAYKTLMLNNLTSAHSSGANCEEDFSEGALAQLRVLFEGSEYESTEVKKNELRVNDGLVNLNVKQEPSLFGLLFILKIYKM